MVKIRTGFVSNSSSTSFTCDVCGETWGGWDGDYGISTYTCENGHDICEKDMIEDEITFKDLIKHYENNKKIISNWDEELLEDLKEAIKDKDRDCLLELLFYELDEVPPEFCPLCTFKHISDHDMNKYLKAELRMNDSMIRIQMRERFKDYGQLQKFCRDNIPQ